MKTVQAPHAHAMQVLNAHTNKLGELPDIGSCFMLEELTLTDNELSSLPESIQNLSNLRILHLGRLHRHFYRGCCIYHQ